MFYTKYEKLSILHAYELVPEAYRQKFRSHRKKPFQELSLPGIREVSLINSVLLFLSVSLFCWRSLQRDYLSVLWYIWMNKRWNHYQLQLSLADLADDSLTHRVVFPPPSTDTHTPCRWFVPVLKLKKHHKKARLLLLIGPSSCETTWWKLPGAAVIWSVCLGVSLSTICFCVERMLGTRLVNLLFYYIFFCTTRSYSMYSSQRSHVWRPLCVILRNIRPDWQCCPLFV